MLLSSEFTNKYKDNIDMQNIIQNVDKATNNMENPLSAFEKEVLYESVYGFQKTRVEPYDLSRDLEICKENIKDDIEL